MTENTSIREAKGAADILEIVETHFDRVLENLEQVQDRLQEENEKGAAGAKAAMNEVRRATGLVLEERTRLEQYRKKASGVAYDYAINLDAARDEIGRRLACLRNIRPTGEISE